MPKDLRAELTRLVGATVAEPLAADVRAAARGSVPFGPRLTVTVARGAEPSIRIGGSKRAVTNGATGRQLVYGVEFGGSAVRHQPAHVPYQRTRGTGQPHSVWRNTTAQFRPARPFIFPTFRARYADVSEAWLDVLDPILTRWEAGDGG